MSQMPASPSPLKCAYARVCSCGAARHSTTGIETSPRPAPDARATCAPSPGADVGRSATTPLWAKARPHCRSKGRGAELSCGIAKRRVARYLRNWRVPRSMRVMSRDGWSRGSSRHACSKEYTSNCARHETNLMPAPQLSESRKRRPPSVDSRRHGLNGSAPPRNGRAAARCYAAEKSTLCNASLRAQPPGQARRRLAFVGLRIESMFTAATVPG